MTTYEFSNEFDILFNNISSNAAPGLNEYEKSVLFTKAQLEILRNYFNAMGNKYREGFDGSTKRQIDFSRLVKIAKPLQSAVITDKFDERSTIYELPDDILYFINEIATVKYDGRYTHKINIVPTTYDEYSVYMSRPYKQPYKNQGWRLINNYDGESNCKAEIITKDGAEISGYTIRYVRKPNPIILMDLDGIDIDGESFGDLSIQGFKKRTECELDDSLHPEILQRAVELAKAAYQGDLQTTLQIGTRAE